MRTKKFWLEALDRAVRTAAQGAVLAIGAAGAGWVQSADTLVTIGWGALGGFVLSLVTSVATSGVGGQDTPSLVKE